MGAADASLGIDQLGHPDTERDGIASVSSQLPGDGLGQRLDVGQHRRRAALGSGRCFAPERNRSAAKLDRARGDLRAADVDADAPCLRRARRVHLALLAPVGRRDAEQE